MKKFLVMLIIVVATAAGCKKDPPVFPVFKNVQLNGAWSMESTSVKYYDVDGKWLTTLAPGRDDVVSIKFNQDQCTVTYRDGATIDCYYTVTKLDDKSKISFSPGLNRGYDPFDIISGDPETSSQLVLEARRPDQAYTAAGGVRKTAAYALYRITIDIEQ
ncbi:MAG: hypothetical protein INR69_15455 [Mucilaginibacter polytrichastri]|nr:hypothetical protein [Mucilaginibacter polytrichastri]